MAGCTRKSYLLDDRERASAVKVHDAIFEAEDKRSCYPINVVKTSPVKDVVIKSDVNISKTIPIIWHCKEDRGPFMTPGVWITKDPDSGEYGMGVFRSQATLDSYGPNKTGALFSAHSDTLKRLLQPRKRTKTCPLRFVLGLSR
ncbi:MAG: UbiD family decarboxylase [Thaumarchaeota archaeon]|nr:UbiD family decarboxylase [Nitrososphaerota archaeon]